MIPQSCDDCCRVRDLEKEIERLNGVIASLQDELKESVRKNRMDSTNSSKPPSSDGYRKPKPVSLRVKSGRRPGGQPGHAGRSMSVPHEPDEVIEHYQTEFKGCSRPCFQTCCRY